MKSELTQFPKSDLTSTKTFYANTQNKCIAVSTLNAMMLLGIKGRFCKQRKFMEIVEERQKYMYSNHSHEYEIKNNHYGDETGNYSIRLMNAVFADYESEHYETF